MPRDAAAEFIRTFLRVIFCHAEPAELQRKWLHSDKDVVIDGIVRHSLAGFVYHELRNRPEWELSAELEQGLKPAAQLIAVHSAVYEREGLKITTLLEEQDIPYLVLKGFSLVERLYAHSGIRLVSDLDIYINWADYAQVQDVLSRQGYQAQISPDFRGTLAEYQFIAESFCSEMQYSRSLGKFKLSLDIHWGMDGLWEGSPLKTLFPIEDYPWMCYIRRARAGDWEFHALSWEMQFLQIVSHFALHHQFQGVKWFVDICLFIKNLGAELDWEFIHKMAMTADNRKTIAVILRMAEDEIGLRVEGVPPWQSFWNGRALPGEYAFYRRRLFSPASKEGQYLAYMLLPLKLRDKFRVMGYYLFDSGAVPHWRAGGNKSGWRWWQPFYLLYRAGEGLLSRRQPDQH